MIQLDPHDARPIWRQIEQGVRYLVAQERFGRDRSVPSVRELAKQLQVNPATVSKAYRQLVADGVLVVRRGEGTFPAPTPPVIPTADRQRRLGGAATSFAALAITLGASEEESLAAVTRAWQAIVENGSTGDQGVKR